MTYKNKNDEIKHITGAEAIIHCLLHERADWIFGYPGGAIMPVYDELYKFRDTLTHILTRHEQGAIHAAQGFARVTGKVGVTIATSGPGATNLVTGLADAQIDSTALVCITGQVGSHLLGTDAFQETDILGISVPITKWNAQVTRAEDIPEVLAKAFYIARSGRPGPVLIDITKDAQFGTFDFSYQPCKGLRSYRPIPNTDPVSLKQAAALINQAKKPMILFGQGVILGKAESEFRAFVEKSGIPSAWTILGLSALDSEHPLNVGMLGMHGNYAPNMLTNECDVLIAIGMRFDDRVTGDLSRYAKQAQIIHFDIDPAEINKNVMVDVSVLGDCKQTLSEILPLIDTHEHAEWLEKFNTLYLQEYDAVIKHDLTSKTEALKMGEVIHCINEISHHDAIVVSDVGQHQMFTCRYAKFQNSRSNVTSGGLGTMGFALPAAIGAKMGADLVSDNTQSAQQVVAIIGDGGFQMTLQELATIAQNQTAVKIVVLNNNHLGMVRQWQELFFEKRYASTVMTNPDFVKIVDGFGIEARRVTKHEDLTVAVQAMFASDKPYFLEVLVEKEDNVFPMIETGASVSEIRLK